MTSYELVDKLKKEHILSREEFKHVLIIQGEELDYLFQEALKVKQKVYGNQIFIRGLIEFTNYCKNDCYYCGLRTSNQTVKRFRLTTEEVLSCCRMGYRLGFRTFVLQGGEDYWYTKERMVALIEAIKEEFPDCALTLSIGEKEEKEYLAYYKAGAERYLLRQETANEAHYELLHPKSLSFKNRLNCLRNLKKIGFQTGCGFMVGSKGQTLDTIVDDLFFMLELNPHMAGIGPFIPHEQTPLKEEATGSVEATLRLIAILRLMFPSLLIPATTALATLDSEGRKKAMLAGANVVMPNLSPELARKNYILYNNIVSSGEEAAEHLEQLKDQMREIGQEIIVSRGDYMEL